MVRQLDVEPRAGNQPTTQGTILIDSPDVATLIGSLQFLPRQ